MPTFILYQSFFRVRVAYLAIFTRVGLRVVGSLILFILEKARALSKHKTDKSQCPGCRPGIRLPD